LNRLAGCLVGTAVGDSLGLPAEGLSRRRIAKRYGGKWRQRLVFGRGMCSDDTEHAFFVAQALLAAGGDVERFRSKLAWKLRWWFLALPAGIGLATARACVRMWLGLRRPGVFSAGNGPVMRASLLGVFFAEDGIRRRSFVEASTRLTHTDPKALTAALAVAETAAAFARGEGVHELAEGDEEWNERLAAVNDHLARDASVDDLACHFGLEEGIGGYAYDTVPMVLFAVYRHRDDARRALESLLDCGGDTDTVGAIAGGLLGIRHEFPDEWVGRIANGPLSVAVLRRAAAELEHGGRPVSWHRELVVLRNLFFLLVVLAHGFGRLFR